MFKTNASKEKQFIYDPNKTLKEQNVSEIARTIIAILFRDYWATENQRQKIIYKQNFDRKKIREEMYNSNSILKKHNIQHKENSTTNEIAMVEYKGSIFTKIKKWFKQTFLNI